jgi:hypothetical protein
MNRPARASQGYGYQVRPLGTFHARGFSQQQGLNEPEHG